jgi:transcription elongation factor GreA
MLPTAWLREHRRPWPQRTELPEPSRGEPVTETPADVVWLTEEQHDKLQAELDYLTGPGRTEVTKKIEAARSEGDLRENGGYHAAKEEQGKREARIRQLTAMLRSAKVGQPPTAEAGVAGPGMIVELRWPGDDDVERVLIGAREHTAGDVEIYSANSPLGKAITGKKPGDRASYTAPTGRQMTVEIVAVSPYSG